MEKAISDYIATVVSVVVAVAILVMMCAVLRLRREAQVQIDGKQYYAELAQYKEKFDGFDKNDLSAVDTISIISMYADELDIYVVGTSIDNSQIIKIDMSNRYLQDYVSITDDEITEGLGTNKTLSNRYKELARQYGLVSAQALGQLFSGEDKWTAYVTYDGQDVELENSTLRLMTNSRISGVRLIKK